MHSRTFSAPGKLVIQRANSGLRSASVRMFGLIVQPLPGSFVASYMGPPTSDALARRQLAW
jgi:hypothetical protein